MFSLASQIVLEILSLLSEARIIDGVPCPPGIYVGPRDPNSSLYMYTTHA